MEAVLHVVFLTQGVGHGFAVFVERPPEQPSVDRPVLDSRLCRTTFPSIVPFDNRWGFAVVLDVHKLLARELHVTLRREWFFRVGKLCEPFLAIVEKSDDALVVVEKRCPSKHFAC